MLNYSADRIASELVGKEKAVASIVMLTHDPYLTYTIDKDAFLNDITKKLTTFDAVSLFCYNLFSDQSVPAFRINALLDEKRSGRLF